jgi:anaerobic magnesium-protoporphyrin IX monomethyl ester cyclase
MYILELHIFIMGKIATRIAFVLPGPSLGMYEESFGFRAPPLAVAYLAGVARGKGIDARFFDASVSKKPEETVIPEIIDYNPDLCAFVVNASSLAGQAVALAGKLKKSFCMLVAGGHHASFSYPLLLRRGFDAVFLGEGERSFSEVQKRR